MPAASPRRQCLDCGALSRGTRCVTCTAVRKRIRNADRATSRAAREAHLQLHGPECPGWRRPSHRVRPSDLTLDHPRPLALGGNNEQPRHVLLPLLELTQGVSVSNRLSSVPSPRPLPSSLSACAAGWSPRPPPDPTHPIHSGVPKLDESSGIFFSRCSCRPCARSGLRDGYPPRSLGSAAAGAAALAVRPGIGRATATARRGGRRGRGVFLGDGGTAAATALRLGRRKFLTHAGTHDDSSFRPSSCHGLQNARRSADSTRSHSCTPRRTSRHRYTSPSQPPTGRGRAGRG